MKRSRRLIVPSSRSALADKLNHAPLEDKVAVVKYTLVWHELSLFSHFNFRYFTNSIFCLTFAKTLKSEKKKLEKSKKAKVKKHL